MNGSPSILGTRFDIEKLPQVLLAELLKLHAKDGLTWTEIEERSPSLRGWKKASQEQLDIFPCKRIPQLNLRLWYEAKIKSWIRENLSHKKRSKELSKKLAATTPAIFGTTSLDTNRQHPNPGLDTAICRILLIHEYDQQRHSPHFIPERDNKVYDVFRQLYRRSVKTDPSSVESFIHGMEKRGLVKIYKDRVVRLLPRGRKLIKQSKLKATTVPSSNPIAMLPFEMQYRLVVMRFIWKQAGLKRISLREIEAESPNFPEWSFTSNVSKKLFPYRVISKIALKSWYLGLMGHFAGSQLLTLLLTAISECNDKADDTGADFGLTKLLSLKQTKEGRAA